MFYRMYQAELVPAAMRGTVVGSLQLFNQVGQVMAAGVNRAYSTGTQHSRSVYFRNNCATKLIDLLVGLFLSVSKRFVQ